jgi:hypothetical protein
MADDTAKNGKKIFRSPNHPAFDLGDAIGKAKTIYEEEKRTPTTAEVIVKHLGYSHTNGPGGRALSGLRQFGLIEESAGHYKISDLAFSILHYPDDSREKRDAIKQAALTPALYRELREQYPDNLPSDDTFRSALLRRNFNPSVLDNVIKDFRTTMTFAGLMDVGYTDLPEKNKMSDPSANSVKTPPTPPDPAILGAKSYAFAFAGDGKAELRIVGNYTREDLEDLKTHLEVTMRGLMRSKSSEGAA